MNSDVSGLGMKESGAISQRFSLTTYFFKSDLTLAG